MSVGGRGHPYRHGCRLFVSGLCMGDGFTGQLLGQMGLISNGQNKIFKVSGLCMVVFMSQEGFVGSLTLTRKLKRRIPGEKVHTELNSFHF